MKRQKVIIMGAAGRDFHNFNTVYRNDPAFEVVAFTAGQIPFIGERVYPQELAGPLYPDGIWIYPEERLEALISKYHVEQVVFAYSDVSHEYVMHKASLCLSLGSDFVLLGTEKTMLRSSRPVISVCAVRTGCGKSGISAYIARVLKKRGMRPAVIRHPMPYGDIISARVNRFVNMDDLDLYCCTIEEREEYGPLINAGVVVYSGVDYETVLRDVEKEADIIVWDGGNNDLPFLRPDLEIVVFDPHRPGHELAYHPGETNLRRADIAIINKVDTADREKIEAVEENIRRLNPGAVIVHTASRIKVEQPERILDRRVLVVEDGPTLTHGCMVYGAGYLAALKFGAAAIADPRPYAVGSIKKTFAQYPRIADVLPAIGYSPEEIRDLRETIESVPCEVVLIATPIDLGGLLELGKEVIRVTYEIEEIDNMELNGYIEGFVDSYLCR